MVLSVAPASSTPPQPGHSTFHDSSNRPRRAACRNAASAFSSSRPCLAAKSSTLTRHRSRSGASATNCSMAATLAVSADCRSTLKRASESLTVGNPLRRRPRRMGKVGPRSLPFKARGRERVWRRPHSELMFVWNNCAIGSRLRGRLAAIHGGLLLAAKPSGTFDVFVMATLRRRPPNMTTIYRYRKETHFAQPPEAVWPLLADTARLNEMAGAPPYQVADRLDPDGRTRRTATAKAGPLRLQWDERFGEWQENSWLTQERQFRNGPFRHFKVHAKLNPEDSGSRLVFSAEVECAGALGFLAKL